MRITPWLVGLVVVGCHGDVRLPDKYRDRVDRYLPKARAIAETNAQQCGTPVAKGPRPHPAAELLTDGQVLDVEVACWRAGAPWQFLGENDVGSHSLKPLPDWATGYWSTRRFYVADKFAEGAVTAPDHRSEYVVFPGPGDQSSKPAPTVSIVVQRPAPSDGWIAVEITLSAN